MLARMTRQLALDPRHKKFADEYLICGVLTTAAKKAGYATGSAHVQGSRLLKRPDIQEYLQAQAAKVTAETETLQEQVVNELKAMAFANIGDFITVDDNGQPQVDFSTATPEQLKAISSIASKTTDRYDKDGNVVATSKESRFTMADKYRGLDLLGQHLGLYKAAEQRVVVDVADRLLNARARLRKLEQGDDGVAR